MTDLIDRAALRAAMYEAAFETDSDEQKWDSGCWIRYKMFERIVESMPSVPSPEPEDPPMTREEALEKLDIMHGAAIMETWHPRNIKALEFAITLLSDTTLYNKEPKVFAHWIEDGYQDEPCVCSHCGTPGSEDFRYCPYCGAQILRRIN